MAPADACPILSSFVIVIIIYYLLGTTQPTTPPPYIHLNNICPVLTLYQISCRVLFTHYFI